MLSCGLLFWCNLRNLPESVSHSGPAQCDSRQAVQTPSSHSDSMVSSPGCLCHRWHLPTVDLFATRYNCKLLQFVSPVPDPKAWAVDVLSLSLENLDLYAFPSVPLLTNVLTKALSHQCKRMIIIAPGWPNMPWFWDLVEMSSQIPICLPNHPDLLTQSFSGNLHKDLQNQNLLEPKLFGNRGSLTKWQRKLKLLEEGVPDLSMKQSGRFLFDGARRIRWTSIHKLQPSTIDGYRSAIADKIGNATFSISKNENLNRLLDGFHRDRPKGHRGVPSWNLSLVLQ